MKTLKLIATLVMLCASTSAADTNQFLVTTNAIVGRPAKAADIFAHLPPEAIINKDGELLLKMKPNGDVVLYVDQGRTNMINALVESGEFCRVRGHTWGQHPHVTLEYVPNRIACRVCQICGLHQSQYATEWK